MAIPRASAAPAVLGRTVFRRAATQTRNQAWRQIGRRHYASGHGGQKSSELPWIIGSVGFTVPAAVWLFGQGPKGAPHAPEVDEERDEEAKEKEDPDGEAAPNEGSAQDPEHEKESTEEQKSKQEDGQDKDDSDSDESKDESKDEESEDPGDDSKQESKDKGKDEAKDDPDSKGGDSKPERKYSDDGYELPGRNAPGQINHKSDSGKGPGEGQKGSRPPTERKGEKDSHHDESGAQNPYITQNKEEKSKKGQGITDTAKIHGTVDTSRPTRGPQADSGKRD